jgi:hypothetical protein
MPRIPQTPGVQVLKASQKLIHRYAAIIECLFVSNYKRGMTEVHFDTDEVRAMAAKLGIKPPSNLGEISSVFRYRNNVPESIRNRTPKGRRWVIQRFGDGRYQLVARAIPPIVASPWLIERRITDATPGIIDMYAMSDEQALLAKLRYNRLLDIFTGIACSSLQSHFRTTVDGMGQIETDEIYVGLDRRGAHYVIPVQAKGGSDRLSVVQIEQDIAVCAEKFPNLICKPVAAQFVADGLIALFAFEEGDKGVGVCSEKHYRLVPPDSVSAEDLKKYRARSED